MDIAIDVLPLLIKIVINHLPDNPWTQGQPFHTENNLTEHIMGIVNFHPIASTWAMLLSCWNLDLPCLSVFLSYLITLHNRCLYSISLSESLNGQLIPVTDSFYLHLLYTTSSITA